MTIKAIIWDLDGTLYSYSPNLQDVCRQAAAKTAISMGADIDEKTAYSMSVESFSIYKNSFQIFVERYGYDIFEFDRCFLQNISTDALDVCAGLANEFSISKVKHAVLTHSSREWAERVLSRLLIRQYFNDDIWGVENVNYTHKDKSPLPFQKVLSVIGIKPQECVVVEDSARNLFYPKQLGMKTVLISGKADMHESNADESFESAEAFLKVLNNKKDEYS